MREPVASARAGSNPRIAVSRNAILVVLVACWACGCGRAPAPATARGGAPSLTGTPTAAKPADSTTDYLLTGVVKKLDAATGQITIRHEEIPGLMGAMTMPFSVADKDTLEGVKPGDSVQATLRVVTVNGVVNDYELRDLSVMPGSARALVLDTSRGQLSFRDRQPPLKVGDVVPEFTMTTQDGQSIKLSDLRGKVVALTFVYTRCPLPDFCPLMDRKFQELAQKVSTFPARAERIRLISLSFDPEHDNPDVLRKHAQVRGAVPPLWTFAVATHQELAKIAAPLGLYFEPGTSEIAHNLSTAVIDRDGRLARIEVGRERNKWDASDMARTIYGLLPPTSK